MSTFGQTRVGFARLRQQLSPRAGLTEVRQAAMRPQRTQCKKIRHKLPAREGYPVKTYSALRPAARITVRHLATSSRSKSENSSGVLPTGSAPCSSSF